MKRFKVYKHPNGRLIQVIIEGNLSEDLKKVSIDIDVLIKDSLDEDFHAVIGETHPKYWKLKRLEPAQIKGMQIKYSGISAKQIRQAVKEFEQFYGSVSPSPIRTMMPGSLVCGNMVY
ncbi:hypothetical protein L0657_08750 [Dyadobacter sp. CY345]|uniref:hypothetical protein n=1 Tax=Dyadobacter sp. CY345 TaxID=2909335 RepID=UPI001F39DE49|nr:hypothetical protein [Dyadobacter sp. CY345]MCF2444042.1 hypothetical protein [Dyadobacter sp. CY345]